MRAKMRLIKYFITGIIAISFFVMIIINGLRTYFDGQADIKKADMALAENIENELDALIEQEKTNLAVAAELLLNDEMVLQLFEWRDRSMLTDHLLPLYENKLKKNFGIKQFQFHLAPATSFLRLHKVGKYGDDLSSFRKTVIQANSSKKIVSGLEVGRGGLGMRLVYPVQYNGSYIGSMEFGTAYNAILERIAKRYNISFAVGVYDEVFKKAGRFENNDSDLIKDNIVFYVFSNSDARDQLKQIEITNEIETTLFNDKEYAVISIPIKNY